MQQQGLHYLGSYSTKVMTGCWTRLALTGAPDTVQVRVPLLYQFYKNMQENNYRITDTIVWP